jgi:hypothetical protein
VASEIGRGEWREAAWSAIDCEGRGRKRRERKERKTFSPAAQPLGANRQSRDGASEIFIDTPPSPTVSLFPSAQLSLPLALGWPTAEFSPGIALLYTQIQLHLGAAAAAATAAKASLFHKQNSLLCQSTLFTLAFISGRGI